LFDIKQTRKLRSDPGVLAEAGKKAVHILYRVVFDAHDAHDVSYAKEISCWLAGGGHS